MTVKEVYYYIFYKFYRTWEKVDNILLSSSFRAEICLMAITMFLYVTLYGYLCFLGGLEPDLRLNEPQGYIPTALVILTNSYFFSNKNKWLPYFEKFDNWPKKKNKIGGIIVWTSVAFIVLNLFISFDLMRQVREGM